MSWTWYTLALFVHVASALLFFSGLGIEWTSLRRLSHATTAETAREWLRLTAGAGRTGGRAMLALLVSGAFMMATTWGPVPWLAVSLGALVPLPALGLGVTRRRLMPLGRAVAGLAGGSLPDDLREALRDRLLRLSIHLRIGIATGIVFLMTVKPGLQGSLAAMAVAVAAGLVPSLSAAAGRSPMKELRA